MLELLVYQQTYELSEKSVGEEVELGLGGYPLSLKAVFLSEDIASENMVVGSREGDLLILDVAAVAFYSLF